MISIYAYICRVTDEEEENEEAGEDDKVHLGQAGTELPVC